MVFNLADILRFFSGGDSKPKPAFHSEKEAYDFCRRVYKDSGGVTPELRRAYEFYHKHYNDDCREFREPGNDPHIPTDVKR